MLSLGDDVDVSDDVHLSDNKKMKIVSIIRFGGLGKTTLAKAVYDHLKPHFVCHAFIPVGRNPDIKKVFRDILMGLDKETYTHSKLKGLDEKQLMDQINELVKEKNSSLMLITSSIRPPKPKGNKGCCGPPLERCCIGKEP